MFYYDDMEFADDEFSLYLIEKYLDMYFEDIDSIKEKYAPNQIARLLGEQDISFFALYYLREIFVVSDDNEARELSKAHYEIWDILNDMFVYDEYDKANIIEPRGLAKTTICNMLLSIWASVYKKSLFTLVGAKKDDDAKQFLDGIKIALQTSKHLVEEFGVLIDPKQIKPGTVDRYKVNSSEIELLNGTYIRAVGSGTSVRGAKWGQIRPTIVIGDKKLSVRYRNIA